MSDSKIRELRGYSREEDEALDDAFFSGIFKTAFGIAVRSLHSEDTTTFRLFNGRATALVE